MTAAEAARDALVGFSIVLALACCVAMFMLHDLLVWIDKRRSKGRAKKRLAQRNEWTVEDEDSYQRGENTKPWHGGGRPPFRNMPLKQGANVKAPPARPSSFPTIPPPPSPPQ